jgi:hypothetical protein
MARAQSIGGIALLKPDIPNLRQHGAEPMMRWLIQAAKERSIITYGEAKMRLETQHGFSTIFPILTGHAAGKAMEDLQQCDPDVPLLTVLLVQARDRMPGNGPGGLMAHRFNAPILQQRNARKTKASLAKVLRSRC